MLEQNITQQNKFGRWLRLSRIGLCIHSQINAWNPIIIVENENKIILLPLSISNITSYSFKIAGTNAIINVLLELVSFLIKSPLSQNVHHATNLSSIILDAIVDVRKYHLKCCKIFIVHLSCLAKSGFASDRDLRCESNNSNFTCCLIWKHFSLFDQAASATVSWNL